MAGDTLLISAGDVIDVQLTSETVVIDSPHGRRVEERGHITNRMRLFVRQLDGLEKTYDFEDCKLGVRETQRVAVVRGRVKKVAEPLHLILFNLSSGERDAFEPGLSAYLGYTPFFGPRWKAVGCAFLVALAFWLASRFGFHTGPVWATMFALMFAFLTYPVFWWICTMWDQISERIRYKRVRSAFIAEMDARVRAYAPQTQQAASGA
jgi:hypothetical protein